MLPAAMWARCRAERRLSLAPRMDSKVKCACAPVISTAMRIISFFSMTVNKPPTSSPLFIRIGSRDAKCVVPLRRARISRARNPFPSLRYPVML
ncbi:MAG: hypothetical protein ACLSHC_06700 [Bilophila wadsworthia]